MTAFLFSILRETPRPLLIALSLVAGMTAVWLWGQI